jgi:hypothetical protein
MCEMSSSRPRIWDERDGMVQCFEFDGISGEWKMVEAYAYS